MSHYSLPGVAVITGAASGIGRATAVAFVRRGCTKLGILDRDKEGLAETRQLLEQANSFGTPLQVVSVIVDVSSPDNVTAAYTEVVEVFSRIDYSVQAAGIVVLGVSSTELSIQEFDRQNAVNYRGLWLCSREALKVMKTQTISSEAYPEAQIPLFRGQRGAIVNVSASLATHAQTGMPAYTGAKSEVLGLTRSDAVDFAKDKIRINAVLPGMDDTPVTNQTPEIRAWLEANPLQRTPLKRIAAPDEIADVICFLAGHGSSYVTGASWEVDGGFLAGF